MDPVSNTEPEVYNRDLSVGIIDQYLAPTYQTNLQQINSAAVNQASIALETRAKTDITKRGRKNAKEPNELKVFRCKVCDKEFLSKSGAKFHEKYQHIEAKLFCLICKKPFKFSCDLDRHMKTHTGHRPFECQDCGKSFICKSSLMQHVRFKHLVGNIFKCSKCSKSFCTEADLKRHEAVHADSKPFKCDQCSKTFTCKSTLNVHKKTHLGRKYACHFCNRHFHIQADLERHVTVHTGERPWRCRLCKKGYSCKSALSVHIKHSHTANPTPDMYVHMKPGEEDESQSNDYSDDESFSDRNKNKLSNKDKNLTDWKNGSDSSDDCVLVEFSGHELTGSLKKNGDSTGQNRKKPAQGNSKTFKKTNSEKGATSRVSINRNEQKSSKETKTSFGEICSSKVDLNVEQDDIADSDDPYNSIDKLNKEATNMATVFPGSLYEANKKKKKAEFVCKMEISDGYVILNNS